jgi:hypothetical protein
MQFDSTLAKCNHHSAYPGQNPAYTHLVMSCLGKFVPEPLSLYHVKQQLASVCIFVHHLLHYFSTTAYVLKGIFCIIMLVVHYVTVVKLTDKLLPLEAECILENG